MKSVSDENLTTTTKLSHINGEKGELIIKGYTIEDFSALGFENACQHLLDQPADLGAQRVRAYAKLQAHFQHLRSLAPTDALIFALANLTDQVKAQEIVASLAVALAANHQGSDLLEPDPSLSHSHDLLRMCFAKTPLAESSKALDTYLTAVSEHGLNASTFCVRVVASTGASARQAAFAGLAALSGPLHGGAPGPVLDLIEEMRTFPNLREALIKKLDSGERLMGFGHRVYKTRDPRATLFKKTLQGLALSQILEQASLLERVALQVLLEKKPHQKLKTNVEFYTAVLLNELGFERDAFTPLFAIGRILGWMAHYQEQKETGRLIRPLSTYVGPWPKQPERV